MHVRRALVAAGVAVLAACGGGGDGGTTNPPPVGGFTVTLSSTTLSVVQGGNGSVTATIARTGSFAGTVDLTTEGVPSGITAAFSPSAITSGTTSTTLAVSVAGTVAPGAYTFTIRGRATGLADQTAQVAMTVTAPPAIGLTLTPAALTVVQGASGQSTVAIARTNLTAPIVMTATGAPTGVTATFSVPTVNSETSTVLTLAVGATVAAGTYPITVTATAGSVTQSATLQLTVGVQSSLAISVAPTAVSVAQGLSGTATVTITRTNVGGNVTVAVTGQPTGVSVGIAPNPATGTTSTLTFNVGGAVAPGNYPLTVTASASGVANATAPLTLTVTPGAASIALSLSRPTLSVAPGDSGATSIVIARTNFSQQVNLAVSGAPANVSTRLSSASTLGNGETLTVLVGAGATPGTYSLTVTGTAAGVTAASTVLTLTVPPPASGSGNVTWSFGSCNAAEVPIWLAAQNGSGQWQRVIPNGNAFSFTITANGGVAFVTQDGPDDFNLTFFWGLLADLQDRPDGSCTTSPATRTVNGSIANYGTSTSATVALGSAVQNLTAPATGFTLMGVLPGLVDLIATRSGINLSNPLAGPQVNRMIIRRGLNPANGSTLPVLDFNGAESFAPVTRALTLNGTQPGEQVSITGFFSTANQGYAMLTNGLFSASPFSFAGVPTAQQVASDLHILNATATSTNGIVTSARGISAVFKDPVDRTLTLGPALSVPAFTTLATAPYLRTRVQIARQAEYDQTFVLSYTQVNRQVSVSMTGGYLGANPFDFAFPDFTGVAGWQNTWGPTASGTFNWVATFSGWTLGGGGFTQPIVDGTLVRLGFRTGVYTP